MDKELNEILEYYGANLDDSGEPDEAPCNASHARGGKTSSARVGAES